MATDKSGDVCQVPQATAANADGDGQSAHDGDKHYRCVIKFLAKQAVGVVLDVPEEKQPQEDDRNDQQPSGDECSANPAFGKTKDMVAGR